MKPCVHRSRSLQFTLGLLSACLLWVGAAGRVDAADKAAINRAVGKAVQYLQANLENESEGELSLAAYALLKGGEPPSNPHVQKVVNLILTSKIQDGVYNRVGLSIGLYEAALDAMILVDIDPEKYQPQIKLIGDFYLRHQRDHGGWTYQGETAVGDTSVTQYALLGLWAVARAGIEIPPEVWDKALMWHLQQQGDDGGFAYRPGTTEGPGGGRSTINMSAAAAGAIGIAAMHLYPQEMPELSATTTLARSQPAPTKKFGILEKRLPAANAAADGSPQTVGPFKPTAPFDEVQQKMMRSVGWVARNFTPRSTFGWNMYYYYCLERMAAMADLEELGGVDWFDACANAILEDQQPDGSWNRSQHDPRDGPYVVGTSFGILFLTRSTAKLLNRLPREDPIGGGILAGGRGLPDNLAEVTLEGGNVKAEVATGALDELLRSLEKSSGDLFQIQSEIVEQIQLGDRTQLVGQCEQLIRLVQHPSAEIRRTALWALGRSDDLRLARYAVAALDDPDIDVLVEAHNALCWMSRRPNAFGLADNPVTGLPENATAEQRHQAVEQWRGQARQNWGRWFLRVCPYEQRDDPFMIKLRKQLEKAAN